MTWKLTWDQAGQPSGPCSWDGITGKPSVFPPSTHNHDALYSLLSHHHDASYAGINHNHTGVYSPANHNHDSAYSPLGHTHSGVYAPVAHNHDALYAPLSHTHEGGGADPWTYLKVTGTDYSTTSSTTQNITGLGWTPLANTDYEFYGMLYLRTATTTVNPRAGLAWATGLTDGVAMMYESQAATTAPLSANGNIAASLLIAVGGLPNTTQSWPVGFEGTFRAGASPGGSVRVTLQSETNGTAVRAMIGSFLRYRIIP